MTHAYDSAQVTLQYEFWHVIYLYIAERYLKSYNKIFKIFTTRFYSTYTESTFPYGFNVLFHVGAVSRSRGPVECWTVGSHCHTRAGGGALQRGCWESTDRGGPTAGDPQGDGEWEERQGSQDQWAGEVYTHMYHNFCCFYIKLKLFDFIKRKKTWFFNQIIFQLGSYQKECFFVSCNSIFGFFGNLTHLSSYVHEMRIHLNVKCVISVALFLQFGLV